MIKKQIKIKSTIKVDCCFWHLKSKNKHFHAPKKIVCLDRIGRILGKKFVRIKLLFVAIFGYPFLPWFFFYRRWKVFDTNSLEKLINFNWFYFGKVYIFLMIY
jgi:hypothetical protein